MDAAGRLTALWRIAAGCMALLLLVTACTTVPGAEEGTAAGDVEGGEGTEAGQDGGEGTEAGQDTGAAEGEAGPVTIWHLTDDAGIVDAAVERCQEDNPDLQAEALPVENDPYKTKLQVALGTAEAPDIFHSWGGGWLQDFVDAGLVANLTPFMEENPDWAGNLPEGPLQLATYDGETYGIPLTMNAVFFFYRIDIFEENGLQPPETYDEFLQVVETLKANDVTPVALANASMWPGAFYLMYFATRIGGAEAFLDAYNREEDASFADPAFVQAGERIQELVDMEAFNTGFNGLNYDTGESRQLLYSGNAAMILQGSWLHQSILEEVPDLREQIGFFPFPAMPDGEGDPTTLVGGASPVFSLSADAAENPAAFTMLRCLTDEQAAQSVADLGTGVPVPGGANIEDEFVQEVADRIDQAAHVQLYYDQFLPPDLAELHKETTQAVFGAAMSPQEAAEAMEEQASQALEEDGPPPTE